MRIVCSSRVSPLTLKYVTVGDCDLFNVCVCRSVALDSADPWVARRRYDDFLGGSRGARRKRNHALTRAMIRIFTAACTQTGHDVPLAVVANLVRIGTGPLPPHPPNPLTDDSHNMDPRAEKKRKKKPTQHLNQTRTLALKSHFQSSASKAAARRCTIAI